MCINSVAHAKIHDQIEGCCRVEVAASYKFDHIMKKSNEVKENTVL